MSAYAALAEPHRRQILDLLCDGERSVGDLVARLKLSQPGVSKHLKVLRNAGLVNVRPEASGAGTAFALSRSPRWTPGWSPTGLTGRDILTLLNDMEENPR